MKSESTVLSCGYSYHTQRFDDQHNNGLHSYLFRLQTEGHSEAVIQGRRVALRPGDLLLLERGSTYELHVQEHRHKGGEASIASGDYYILCEGEWIDSWWTRSSKPSLAHIDPDEKLLGLWRHLIAEKRRQPGGEDRELIDYLLRTICLYLERAVTEAQAPSARPPFAVLRMKRYIEENATSRFKIEDAAKYAGLSTSRSVHLFKQHVGQSMMAYATGVRLSAALERMKYTSMTLHQIAENCGFGEYSYFHKVFKQYYGISPGVYRDSITNAADENLATAKSAADGYL
ncbi:helix-turn-helix transcriptional regulator [Paenibacillus spongiae]|uniref:AraC family transcriptional regulator n=1 Tax=Paenibacillus spongiae TaxID=2909671 RepID=A0ABY5S3S0_9BACL|nr:AraC family transcriptional regulator [Paenibacillus spongiae]UVI28552.1 AraC family transcriptional regulator [Paenibacillus spongiae]